MKDFLSETLGFFGAVIYQALTLIGAMLPAWVVSNHYIESTIVCIIVLVAFYVLSMIFPIVGGIIGLVLWIWGLVIVIGTGPLWLTIVYIVFFVISMIKLISTLFSRR